MRFSYILKLLIMVLAVTCMPLTADASFGTLTKPDITVSPAITEWVLKPGETQTKTLRAINPKDSPMPMRVVVKAMEVQEGVTDEAKHIFDASSWFSIDEPYFILKAKEIHDVKVTLRMPKDAEPGGHYATIYFQQFVAVGTQKQTVATSQVGALAFITTNAGLDKHLEASEPISTAIQPDGLMAIGLTLHNVGNIHVLPAGRFIVSDWKDRTITTLTLPNGIVLPHTARTYTTNWKPPFIGYITIRAEISYGESHQILIQPPQGFWIFPGGWALSVVVTIAIVWWFGFRIRKRWVRAIKLLLKDY